ncbi:undecaprenyl/decaprenyl-phosphate alpha-N-acetylglucosaminyl 1-phosphate transferase [Candidatus Dojkabacteria bacterium]|nr:undecaprenyl/decaprenyl-phosphate alpha-N-acetylglucosaminyl 1-phosphate transferase [Candidatus Dojkabacteria bacterium]
MEGTINDITNLYLPYIPKAGFAFLIAFLITPIIGKIAKILDIVDLPKEKRSLHDKTRDRRIHEGIIPKLGGLAIMISFFSALLVYDNVPAEIFPILFGMGVLTLMGILDDKYDISGKYQILIQLFVALVVIVSGITIADIQIAGQFIDLSSFNTTLDFGLFSYNMILPADLFTLLWIMIVMNALAWVCGIDALGESITVIAAVTFAALSIKFGNPQYTLMFFLFAGAVYGFIPYNFPKAKIFAGTSGHINYGFFLATMGVISGTKLPSAILILSVPIIDMLWVLAGRLRANRLNSALDLLSISDTTHLHHRIMNLGFNSKETLRIELSIFLVFCVVAFYFGGFSTDFVFLTAGIVLIILFFTLLGVLYKLNWRRKREREKNKPKDPVSQELTPEEKYAY